MTVIGLLGATGYTAGLTGEVLAEAGLTVRRGARSADRLAALPRSELAEDVVVDVDDDAGLDAFLDGCDVVVNTVGPFLARSRPVVEAAVRTRTPYVDCNGEPDFLRWLYAAHRDAPVPLVSSCGMEYVPADAAVALAAAQLEAAAPLTDVVVGYRVRGGRFSKGTLQTVLDAAQVTAWRPRVAMLPFVEGEAFGVTVPWGENEMVPLRAPGARVRTAFAVPRWVARGLASSGPVIERTGTAASRLTAPVLQRFLDRAGPGPGKELRDRNTWTVVAAVRDRDGRAARAEVSGVDGYGLTAHLLVACARRVAAAGPGAQSPAEAFDVEELLTAVAASGISWRTG